ncbi:MAG: hypothetical protein ACFFDR_02190, partial [Candidatus Thorarchaeota archaeon]
METEFISIENEEDYNPKQFNIAGSVTLLTAMVSVLFGGVIFLNIIVGGILDFFSIAEPAPNYMLGVGLQSLLALVVGYILFRISIAIYDHEMWAFSTGLYINILSIVIFLSLGYPGLLLALGPVLSIMVL